MPKKRVVVDSDDDDSDDNVPLSKRHAKAPLEEEEDLFGDRELQAPPKRSSAATLRAFGFYALVEKNTGIAMEQSAARKLPSARGLPVGAVAAQREAMRQRFGKGAQASEEQNGADVPLDANGRPKKPEAAWARWGRCEDDDCQPDPTVYAPTSPADAALLALVPPWPLPPPWLQDDDHEHLVPKCIPKPPAHLVEGTGTAPRFPAKPKLPNHRALSRISDGFLLSYTHPLTKNEVLVVHRSTRIQTAIKKFGMSVKEVLEAMDLICHQSYEMVHVGGDAMAYWIDNIKAEVEDRRMAPADTVSGLVAQWLLFANTDALFAGLVWSAQTYKHNAVLDPVAHHLYRTERKQQEAANAKAQKKIDAWGAKYSEAWQTHEKRCDEWRKHAAEKGAAVAYREYAADNDNSMMVQYRFEQARVMMRKQSSHKDFSYIMQPSLSALLDKVRHLRTDGQIVASEAQRYHDNRKHVSPFQAKLMLRNAIGANREYHDRITKEMDSARELVALSESWVKELREHQNQWVMAECAALKRALEKINATGEREMRKALETAYAYGYVCTDKTLEKWPGAAWTKPYEDGILHNALATEDELDRRIAKAGSFLSDHRRLCEELKAQLREYACFFKPLPGLDDADASVNEEEEEEEEVVFTKEVTREERDAMGRAQAEILD